uniref:Uncharacterized protein n=1 Tax=Sphaerodactylus townsendi TaxID=933632 RepID=A0ACB8EJ70_9SAUR
MHHLPLHQKTWPFQAVHWVLDKHCGIYLNTSWYLPYLWLPSAFGWEWEKETRMNPPARKTGANSTAFSIRDNFKIVSASVFVQNNMPRKTERMYSRVKK